MVCNNKEPEPDFAVRSVLMVSSNGSKTEFASSASFASVVSALELSLEKSLQTVGVAAEMGS